MRARSALLLNPGLPIGSSCRRWLRLYESARYNLRMRERGTSSFSVSIAELL